MFAVGRQSAFDVASFARECASTNVRVLGPDLFPTKVMSGVDGTWFVDFFAPVMKNFWLHFVFFQCFFCMNLYLVVPTVYEIVAGVS